MIAFWVLVGRLYVLSLGLAVVAGAVFGCIAFAHGVRYR